MAQGLAIAPDASEREIGMNLWRQSYPTMLAFALQVFYDLVDMAWVGQISRSAAAGVTLFSTIYFLTTVLNEVAGTSSVALLSQAYGRGERARLQRIAEQTIAFKVVLALITSALLFLISKPLLHFYTDDLEAIQAGLDYGFWRTIFVPLSFSSYSVNTCFRCTGSSQVPMRIMVIAAVFNMILDPILMFETIPGLGLPGLGLGVSGAALATVISTALSFFLGFRLLFGRYSELRLSWQGLFKLDPEIDRQLLMIGLPSGFEQLLRELFNALLMKFVAVYGTAAVFLFGILGKVFHIGMLPARGFSMGGSTVVGYFIGLERFDDAALCSKVARRISLGAAAVFSFLVCLVPRQITALFTQDEAVLAFAPESFRLFSCAILLASYFIGRAVIFAGAGYNRPMLLAGLISRWFVQLPVLVLLVQLWQVPLPYVILSHVAAELTELLIIVYYEKGGAWRRRL